MKGFAVIAIFITAVCTASILHVHRSKHTYTEIDMVTKSLSGARQYIPATANIELDNHAKVELMFWARYILAPSYFHPANGIGNYDTTLIITDIAMNADSLLIDKKFIWQQQDSLYHYYLITKH